MDGIMVPSFHESIDLRHPADWSILSDSRFGMRR